MVADIKLVPETKILVVDLAFIGDLLMSTPAYANLRRAFPENHIDLLAAPGSRAIVESSGFFNRIFTSGIKKGGWKAIRLEAELTESERYDCVVAFHRGHGSLLMLKMAGVPFRIGFTHGGRGLLLTHGVRFDLYRHRTWNHLNLIDQCLPIEVDYSTPTYLKPSDDAVESVKGMIAEHAPGAKLAIINPNAAWPTKRWTPEGFAYVADALSEKGYLPVLVGSGREEHVCSSVAGTMKNTSWNLAGKTSLQELAALMAESEIAISNDSGPMHIAHAVGTLVVSIFGPTDPARCGPWHGEIEPIQHNLDCIKCYRKQCWHLKCMRELDRDKVLSATLKCIS